MSQRNEGVDGVASLSEQVDRLEKRAEAAEYRLGEIKATLLVNANREETDQYTAREVMRWLLKTCFGRDEQQGELDGLETKHDIKWAAGVLNKHKWDGHDTWRPSTSSRGVEMVEADPYGKHGAIPWHLPFEAIAIAERLERLAVVRKRPEGGGA